MGRNDYAIKLVCREELKAIGKPSSPEEAEMAKVLRRILKNVKDGDDISNEDWEVYEQAKEDIMSALEDL